MPYLTGKNNPFSQKPLATNVEREEGEEPQLRRTTASRHLMQPLPSPLNGYRSSAVREIGSRAQPKFPTGGRRRTRRRHPKKRTRKNKKKHF